MTWTAVGDRRYFYTNEWLEGRSVRRYFGAGPPAQMASAQSDLRRVEREVDRRVRTAYAATWEEADAGLENLDVLTDLVVRAAMALAGYHQHARGQWRRRRGRP